MMLILQTVIFYSLAVIFFLSASKNYLMPVICFRLLKWEKVIINDLQAELVNHTEFARGIGYITIKVPCLKCDFYFKNTRIKGELKFREKYSFSDRKMMQFVENIKFLTFYINPNNPKQFFVVKPEQRIQYAIIAILIIGLDFWVRSVYS